MGAPLSFQALAGAAERLRERTSPEAPEEEWLPFVEEAHERLGRHPFVALPLDAFSLVESGGKRRQIVVSRPADRVIEEALLPHLRRAVEPRLAPSVHGFRKGRSTLTAAMEATRALRAGLHHVALLDIAGYFGAIDRSVLRQRLEEVLPLELVEVVSALVAAPLSVRGECHAPAPGIPQGRAVSPHLANLYLTGLDEAMTDPRVVYVRYVDDLFLASASGEALESAERCIREVLCSLGLMLHDGKTRRLRYDGTPFVYLGHAIDTTGVFERIGGPRLERLAQGGTSSRGSDDAPAADAETATNRRCQTLYVTERGLYLAARQGLVQVIRAREIQREIPLHRVDRVLVLAGVTMTSGFLSACVARRIPVLFFVGRGKAYGCLVSGGLPNPLRLRSQYRLSGDSRRRMALGREIVRSKIAAMSRRLVNVSTASRLGERLAELGSRVPAAEDPCELRGLEGSATRIYYEGFAERIKPAAFAFVTRSRRPPKDPINSLLSFAYSLLFGEMQTALLAHGLDPHPGVLHDLGREHPALASDLIEPYRPLVADSFVLTLVNNGRVSEEGFERREEGGVFLSPDARRAVLVEYEAFMERTAGGSRGASSPRALLHAAATAMLRVVLGDADALDLPLTGSDIEDEVAAEAVR